MPEKAGPRKKRIAPPLRDTLPQLRVDGLVEAMLAVTSGLDLDATLQTHFQHVLPIMPVSQDQALAVYDVTHPLPVTYDGFPIPLTRAVALALLVSGMKDAATVYSTNQNAAVTIMEATLARFEADVAEAGGDPDLTPEIAFATKLLDLMVQGAPQGNLYGGY